MVIVMTTTWTVETCRYCNQAFSFSRDNIKEIGVPGQFFELLPKEFDRVVRGTITTWSYDCACKKEKPLMLTKEEALIVQSKILSISSQTSDAKKLQSFIDSF